VIPNLDRGDRFDPESPESEKLTDSVSEKEEKDIDECELDTKVNRGLQRDVVYLC
jgi:hypothetical protein